MLEALKHCVRNSIRRLVLEASEAEATTGHSEPAKEVIDLASDCEGEEDDATCVIILFVERKSPL